MSEKAKKQVVASQYIDPSNSFEDQNPKSPRAHSGSLCKGFRTSDPHRNVMGQCTEMSPLASLFFRTFPNP